MFGDIKRSDFNAIARTYFLVIAGKAPARLEIT